MNATHALYADKTAHYYSGARYDIVADLPANTNAAVLELGCGDGSTGALTFAANKAAYYCGIELNPDAAALARLRLTDVIEGDIATLDLGAHAARYDVLIASEVLEHLIDPWEALTKLVACLKPGGLVLASSPNIAHWRVVTQLIHGRFDHSESGVMDRSHLRWFTPQSYAALFDAAGLEVVRMGPITPPATRTRWLNAVTRARFSHLFMTQIYLIARKPLVS